MPQNGLWRPYIGSDALMLALVLLLTAGALAYLGIRLHRPIAAGRPGRLVSGILVLMWGLSCAAFFVAVSMYVMALQAQRGNAPQPANPISPITGLSGVATFLIIGMATRDHGLRLALGSAAVGTLAAPMIFELPFDLIVMFRTYPPAPTTLYTLLFFLPLFLVEISSLSLLTLSPLTKVTKVSLFSLAAVFLVFAIWALFGFRYPSTPIPFALNALSKILCFVTSISMFLGHEVRSEASGTP